ECKFSDAGLVSHRHVMEPERDFRLTNLPLRHTFGTALTTTTTAAARTSTRAAAETAAPGPTRPRTNSNATTTTAATAATTPPTHHPPAPPPPPPQQGQESPSCGHGGGGGGGSLVSIPFPNIVSVSFLVSRFQFAGTLSAGTINSPPASSLIASAFNHR